MEPRSYATLKGMNIDELVSSIDSELARLREARQLLTDASYPIHRVTVPARKRTLSAEARERIASAQRKRWAAQKKAAKKAA
jgi:hypothetical protein